MARNHRHFGSQMKKQSDAARIAMMNNVGLVKTEIQDISPFKCQSDDMSILSNRDIAPCRTP